MTGALLPLAGPRTGARGSGRAAVAMVQGASIPHIKCSGGCAGVSGASFSAAC